MTWCPVSKSDCRNECAWLAEGQCALVRLHDITDCLDQIQEALVNIDETIENKSFTE